MIFSFFFVYLKDNVNNIKKKGLAKEKKKFILNLKKKKMPSRKHRGSREGYTGQKKNVFMLYDFSHYFIVPAPGRQGISKGKKRGSRKGDWR